MPITQILQYITNPTSQILHLKSQILTWRVREFRPSTTVGLSVPSPHLAHRAVPGFPLLSLTRHPVC